MTLPRRSNFPSWGLRTFPFCARSAFNDSLVSGRWRSARSTQGDRATDATREEPPR